METPYSQTRNFAFNGIQINAIKSLLQESFLNRHLIVSPGLIDGRFGLCVNMLFCGKKIADRSLVENGSLLLNEICQEISLQTSQHFRDGLPGIGWGILHLIEHRILDLDPREVLLEIDHIVKLLYNMRSSLDFDFNSGHFGRCIYLSKALSVRTDTDDLGDLFLRQTAIQAIEQLYVTVSNNWRNLSKEENAPSCYWNLIIAAQLLTSAKEMDVFTTKVEKASELLLRRLIVPNHHFNKLAIASELVPLKSILPNNSNLCDIYHECISTLRGENLLNELSRTQDSFLLNFDLIISSFLYSKKLMIAGVKIDQVLNLVEDTLHNSLKYLGQSQQSYDTSMIMAQRLRLFDGYSGFYKLLH